MTYTQKYYEEIFLNNLENAYDNDLISHNEEFVDYVKSKQDISNFYVMNLSVISDGIDDVYYDMTDVYNSNKVTLALGEDLDRSIGDAIGCPRPDATYASVVLTFTTENYDTVKTIPSGIQVSTDDGVTYSTIEDVNLPPNNTEIDVQAYAVNSGMSSRVLANTLTHFVSDVGEESIGVLLKSVTNQNSSTGGYNAFNDEEYRELLLNHRKENIRGSFEAFEKFFDEYDGLNRLLVILLCLVLNQFQLIFMLLVMLILI